MATPSLLAAAKAKLGRYLTAESFSGDPIGKAFALARSGRHASPDALRVAIVATWSAEGDTGLTRLALGLARLEGTSGRLLDDVAAGRTDKMDASTRAIHDFARASLRPEGPSAEQRRLVRELVGATGLFELAVVMAAARMLPQVRRTLGVGRFEEQRLRDVDASRFERSGSDAALERPSDPAGNR